MVFMWHVWYVQDVCGIDVCVVHVTYLWQEFCACTVSVLCMVFWGSCGMCVCVYDLSVVNVMCVCVGVVYVYCVSVYDI